MGEEVLKGNMKSLQTTDQESSLRDCVINAQHEQNILHSCTLHVCTGQKNSAASGALCTDITTSARSVYIKFDFILVRGTATTTSCS